MAIWQMSVRGTDQDDGAGTVMLTWRLASALVVALYVVVLAVYSESAISLIEIWSSSNLYGHGFAILPTAVFLLWLRRDSLKRFAPQPSVVGVGMFVACSLLWLVGEAASINLLRHLALVSMLPSIFVAVFGVPAARASLLPLAYLLFAVPVGGELVPLLQDFTAAVVAWILDLTGIPAIFDAVYLVTPVGSFEIAEACAGARFLISSVAAGVFGAALFYRRAWKRLAFIAAAVVIAVFGNAIRAYLIVAIANWHGLAAGLEFDHVTFGFLFLSVILVTLFSIGLVFKDATPAVVSATGDRVKIARLRPKAVAIAVAILPAALLPNMVMRLSETSIGVAGVTFEAIPSGGPWRAEPVAAGSWHPVIANADGTYWAEVASPTGSMTLHVGYFIRQRQGAEIVQELNRYFGGEPWREVARSTMTLNLSGSDLQVPCSSIDDGATRLLACHFFWVDGEFSGSWLVAKFRQTWQRLTFQTGPAAVIGFAVEQTGDATAAAAQANSLFGSVLLDQWLGTAPHPDITLH